MITWDAVTAVAQLLGSLGVIITLAYLAVQIRQSNADSARNARLELIRILATDRVAARVFADGQRSRASLTEEDRRQFDALCGVWLQSCRQFFVKGKIYPGLVFQFENPGIRDWWDNYSVTFPQSDRDYVNRVINDLPLVSKKNASTDAATSRG